MWNDDGYEHKPIKMSTMYFIMAGILFFLATVIFITTAILIPNLAWWAVMVEAGVIVWDIYSGFYNLKRGFEYKEMEDNHTW